MIYNDVVQTSLMFLGIAVVLIVTVLDVGGLGKVIEIADAGGRLEFFK